MSSDAQRYLPSSVNLVARKVEFLASNTCKGFVKSLVSYNLRVLSWFPVATYLLSGDQQHVNE